MKYLSFLALLSTALVSTVEASRQPKPYFTDDEVNPGPIQISVQQRLAPMKMHQRQPQTIQEQLNEAYHHQFPGNSQTQIHAVPTSVPQFFTYLDASKFNEHPTPESPRLSLALTGNISPQQNRQPISLYEQLRRDQNMACDLMAAQKVQDRERRLATGQAVLEWVEYLPNSTTQRLECAKPLEQQRAYKWHDQTVSSYAPIPNSSHTSEQPLHTKEDANISVIQQTKPSSAPLPKPIPLAPSPLNNTPAPSPFSLTLKELYALAPVTTETKASRNINTNTHGHTHPLTTSWTTANASSFAQPLEIIPTAPIIILPPLTEPSATPLTKPHNYERRLFIDGSDPRVNTEVIAQGLSDAFKMHFNPTPNHQRNPIYQSLLEERTRLQRIKSKRIEEYVKLSKLERGIPMIELFGTPENFEFSAGLLTKSLYDLKVLPSRRFAIYTLLTSPQHYGQMLDLHHYTRIKKFEDEAEHNTIFSLPRFFRETPIKIITKEETTSHLSALRFRPYTLSGAIEKNADTSSLYDFFRSLSVREIMGEETSTHSRAYSFNALMHEKASPIVRAVALHFKANRILYELQTGKWRFTDSFNAETVRQCLEHAYHCLESLSFLEIRDVTMRQEKLDFKQTLLHEINEDANALRFLFTHG